MKKLFLLALVLFLIGWRYSDLPMERCAWCGRTVDLNRHHIIPHSFSPELVNTPTNLVVLCRDCHFVLGHRCDWKTYNPDLGVILVTFTNRVVQPAD
jgi:hypothetical protein